MLLLMHKMKGICNTYNSSQYCFSLCYLSLTCTFVVLQFSGRLQSVQPLTDVYTASIGLLHTTGGEGHGSAGVEQAVR